MKVNNLSGAALDWAVAKCEGYIDDIDNYRPSENWMQGGPIIERQISKIWKNLNGTYCAQIKYRASYYSKTYDADIGADAFINKHGTTILEAAMRCYVAYKLGEDVDIPKELS